LGWKCRCVGFGKRKREKKVMVEACTKDEWWGEGEGARMRVDGLEKRKLVKRWTYYIRMVGKKIGEIWMRYEGWERELVCVGRNY
jgi:hypothetical protein